MEELQPRLVPAVAFDLQTGLLRVFGDEAGAAHDVIALSITGGGFVDVRFSDVTRTSDPASPDFDPRLAGANDQSVRALELQGGSGNDVLTVSDGFVAASGHIVLGGGAGHDRLVGSNLADRLHGGRGRDTLVGAVGNDTLRGGIGRDSIIGGAGNDSLGGGAGDDQLDGGDGSDTLAGRAGDDSLNGGADDDLVVQQVDADQTLSDTLVTGQGIDSLVGIEQARLSGGPGGNTLDASAFASGPVTLDGGAGDDTVSGGAGNDALDGGPGTDLVVQVADADQTLTDTGLSGLGDDLVTSMEAARVTGGAGNNLLDASGFSARDGEVFPVTLVGGDGNDTLVAAKATNELNGGNGDDTYVLHTSSDPQFGGNFIFDDSGTDVLDFSRAFGGGVRIDLSKDDGLLQQLFRCPSPCGNALTGQIENVIGAPPGNEITGNAAPNLLVGGTGQDLLNGGEGDDTLVGNESDDRLNGQQGADELLGGAGFDTLVSDQADTIVDVGPDGGEVVSA